MSKKFLTPINLTNLSSDPATGSEGDLYFNTTDNVVKIYADGIWTELQGGSGGGASVIYQPEQPDVTGLTIGTVWVDSNAEVTGGGGGGGGTGGPSFQTIVTIPTSASVIAATAGEILTLVSGSNIYITNASANNSITIGVTGIQEQIDSLVTSIGPSSASATASRITAYVKNGSTALAKGVPVYVTGADGTNIIVGPSSNTAESTSSKTLGFTQTALNANQHGYIVLEGTLTGINTNSANIGDPIWLGSSPGTVIYGLANKPQAPNHLVYLGVVSRVNTNNGEIFVKIQNGFEIKELHDVRINGVVNDDILLYNSASSIWVNSPKQNIINTASAAAVSYLVDGAPEALNTLNELSEALNDNANILDTLLTTTAASSTYLPKTASAAFTRWTKTLSASATVISGADDNFITLQYNPSYEQVFINGVLIANNEYTATSGSAIVLAEAAVVNDVIDIYAYQNSTNVNTYSQAQIDAKYNQYTRWKKIYSASATVISGNDDNSLPLSYTSGYEQVYLNGILLTPITDYARTSASVITLPSAVVTNDVIEVINIQPFNVADVYTTSQANSTFLTQASASTTYLDQLSYQPGLVLVRPASVVNGTIGATGAVSFTSASVINLNGCFSSAYDNYKILINISSATDTASLLMRLRASGSDNSGATSYQRTGYLSTPSALSNSYVATNSLFAGSLSSGVSSNVPIEIMNPFKTIATSAYLTTFDQASNNSRGINMMHIDSTSFDGFSLIISAGSVTGTVRIYGYRN